MPSSISYFGEETKSSNSTSQIETFCQARQRRSDQPIKDCEISQSCGILMKMRQNEYSIKPITVNGRKVSKVVIDEHYKENHGDYMSDELILKLVKQLDGRKEIPENVSNQYSYFATLIEFEDKRYRLVWLLENGAIYIGVVNAYRDRRRK